ncbi:CehA/McbA family metallohydrolase [Planctomycetaceae bacterium]|nr:CehA/McbA family metallohydrolase [Planctomycetaceae bacterium]
MKNDQISLVIAAPLATRDANMTIRNIGGAILDLTLNHPSNDQLSAYIPTAGRYQFRDPTQVETGRDGDAIFWQCRSSKSPANDGSVATVRYQLADGDAFVEASIIIEGDRTESFIPFDGVRADGWFKFDKTGSTAYCSDEFFRQTIGFEIPSGKKPPTWKQGRPYQLRYANEHVERTSGRLKWRVLLYPATSPLDLVSAVQKLAPPPVMYTFNVLPKTQPPQGFDSVNRTKILLRSGDAEDQEDRDEMITLQTNDQGVAHARLMPGSYTAVASAIGYDSVKVEFEATGDNRDISLPLDAASGFQAEVYDKQGELIPVKATIYSLGGDHPNFGLSSTRTFVENCVYSVHGQLYCPLDPGKYEMYFSRGPEYDMESRELEVVTGQMQQIKVQLERVVDTTGWISSDLHSHSSPSGDNTSDQYGRVENLLCEHLEFAPCTEHNRINSYTPHLKQMDLTHLMATCTGIELTGSPTPANHQNAFPLHHHRHTQNGGGPRASFNPELQIERLAMWDNNSKKLVQMNHPNLHQIYGDANTDGIPDEGFREMLRWTDVVEVHPMETIFRDIPNRSSSGRRKKIAMLQWLQLLNQGHRIPGVINTDSHYNHHGSGWRRNWFASSTDDPAKISTDEMVREIEAGHIVMSNGPFLSVSGLSGSQQVAAIPGDDLLARDGKVSLKIRVQCPNWLDVNRVQVFINGRPSAKHNYSRTNSNNLFGNQNAVVKFDSTLNLILKEDTHVIVATIGENLTMENVMGGRYGRRAPMAVSNPIFVDIDGDGFQHNSDKLDLPLPGSHD